MKRLQIDRTKHLIEEPRCGHNRWHHAIEPMMEVEPGEEVGFECRDSADGYVTPDATVAGFAEFPLGCLHPLTGPAWVKGAKPGDLLEVEFLDISTEQHGFSCIFPGMGFMPDQFPAPFLAHWQPGADGFATSAEIPGVRIPGAPFMGISGVAPSAEQTAAWARREAELMERGGVALPPDPTMAVPESIGKDGLRTLPPRENGGNFDAKQLTKGAKLYLPVNVEGALFSTGDGHYAQGDGEVCLTAIEIASTCVVRFKVHSGAAEQRKIRFPYYERGTFFGPPKFTVPERFVATMGMPIDHEGANHFGDLGLAARNAVLAMIDRLGERGYSREQAFVICSVAADLRINNVVDVPNFTVSCILSEDIFSG